MVLKSSVSHGIFRVTERLSIKSLLPRNNCKDVHFKYKKRAVENERRKNFIIHHGCLIPKYKQLPTDEVSTGKSMRGVSPSVHGTEIQIVVFRRI